MSALNDGEERAGQSAAAPAPREHGGFRYGEALRRFVDPEKVRRWDAASEGWRRAEPMRDADMAARWGDPLARELVEALAAVERDLRYKLKTRAIEATYMPDPLPEDGQRRSVPASWWDYLRIESFPNYPSRAFDGARTWKDATLRLRDVLFFPRGAAPAPGNAAYAVAVGAAPAAPIAVPVLKRKRPSPVSDKELREWYDRHLETWRAEHGREPSRDDDWETAKMELGGRVTRKRVLERRVERSIEGRRGRRRKLAE